MINDTIEIDQIKKIFSNRKEKEEYLKKLYDLKKIKKEIPKYQKEIDNEIIKTWNFKYSNLIIREMFKKTEKYINGKLSNNTIKELIKQWNELNLGILKWPFHPRGFDQYIEKLNVNKTLTETEKDEIIKQEIVKFRRIKKINAARNDYIEYLVIENNENITPTLKHSKGVDFYINGYPFDQKVSKSVTKEFINDFGDNWKVKAKNNPELVAKYLYKYQDEERFGSEPRLLIVYLDDDITQEDIYKCVSKNNFKKPYHITFEYNHSKGDTITYNVDCYILLLCK